MFFRSASRKPQGLHNRILLSDKTNGGIRDQAPVDYTRGLLEMLLEMPDTRAQLSAHFTNAALDACNAPQGQKGSGYDRIIK